MEHTDPTSHAQIEQPAPVGHAVVQGYLKTLDSSPGVYRMLDRESRVLYVGKARNLRAPGVQLCAPDRAQSAYCSDDLDDGVDDVPDDPDRDRSAVA